MSTTERNPTVSDCYNEYDYEAVERKLRKLRKVFVLGEREQAAHNLRHAYHFALFSIQTPLPRHEEAYRLWAEDGRTVEEACGVGKSLWPNRKARQASATDSRVRWSELVEDVKRLVVENKIRELMELQERLVGVSYNKWGFTLAMSGIWEAICMDTNVKNHFGIDQRLDMRAADGLDWYMGVRELIQAQVPADVPAFIAQWVIFDYERGEHSSHETFFDTVHPFV